jgi:myo-inositol-1(or 4)-monophosphatase
MALTALVAAEAAAAVHLDALGEVTLEAAVDKGISDFVTEVDLEAQRAALAVIRKARPGDAVLAEEESEEEEATGEGGREDAPLWIVDPLDGTTNFLHGHPAFCASVGVVTGGVPVAGAVVAALTGERYLAREGHGAWSWRRWSGGREPGEPTAPVRLRTSTTPALRRALVGTGFPFKRPHEIPGYLEELGRILQASGGVRRDGAAALDLCLLARGTFDAFWEGTLSPWDVAGGLAILAEAGGAWSGPGGAPYDVVTGGPLRAANGTPLLGALHAALREGGGESELQGGA